MSNIEVIGYPGKHKVTESLGYSHDRACYAKAVVINGKERIVVSNSSKGPWKINVPVIAPFPKIRGQ